MERTPKLGELITHNEKRDAIHFAVAPVVAHGPHPLKPGDFVTFAIKGNTEQVVATTPANAIGIIDPFLTVKVQPGDCCWMMLMPNTITSLRHEWAHPAFDQDTTALSEFWLREFCNDNGLDYTELIEGFRYNDYINTGDNDMNGRGSEELDKHLSVVLGRKVEGASFSCAC